MKHLVASLLLLGSTLATVQAQNYFDDKVFSEPVEYTVPYTNDECRITDIRLGNSSTSITFEFKTGYIISDNGYNYSLNYNTALVDAATGQSFPLLYTAGYMEKQPFKMMLNQHYTSFKFELIFPPLPADVKSVNLTLEPGGGTTWRFNDIKVGNVPRVTDDFTNIVLQPKASEVYPGVKVLQTMRSSNGTMLIIEFKAPRSFNFRLNPMTAYNPATKKTYGITVIGLPETGKDEPVYFESGTVDAGLLVISDLPANVRVIDILENGHPLVKGLKL